MGAKEELFFENVVEIKTIFIIFCQKITKERKKYIYIRFSTYLLYYYHISCIILLALGYFF